MNNHNIQLLKMLRDLTGLSQAQFAKKYHQKLSSIRHWEQGHRNIQSNVLYLLGVAVLSDIERDIPKQVYLNIYKKLQTL